MTAGSLQIDAAAHRDNTRALARDAVIERLGGLLLLAPCLVLVFVCVVLPCGWLFWLSAFGVGGNLSTENYARILESESYARIFLVTFEVSLLTVAACTVIGVPFSAFVAGLPQEKSRWFLAAVLLPFWTSLLVRAYAWLVLLQRNGLVNTLLVKAGIVDAPLSLVFNMFSTVLGMTHIMLPLFILPVYGAMTRIDRGLVRAAASLGASRAQTFRWVFLPLALPGIAAGAVLVFVTSLGFYVTPAILGGGKVYMIAMRIERSLSNYANWGAASALGMLLLLATGSLLGISLVVLQALRRRWQIER